MPALSYYTVLNKTKLFIPLAVCLLSVPAISFAQKFEREGNVVTYRNNKFEYLPEGQKLTIVVTDPVTRKEVTKTTTTDPVPIKMNGIKVFSTSEVTQKPTQVDESLSLEMFVLKGLTSEFNKLPDGRYLVYLSNIIIDTKGKLVYYEYEGIASERSKVKIPDSTKKAIDDKIDPLMQKAPVFKPGRLNGKAVIVRTDISLGMFTVVVKKHKAITTRS